MRDWWLETFSLRGDTPALMEGERVVSYAELAEAIRDAARRLAARGVGPHSVVALHADFSAGGVAAFFALAGLRAVVVPMVEAGGGKLDAARAECGAEFLCRVSPELTAEPLAAGARPGLYERLEGRGAAGLVLLSSGSTGTSKAILHDLDALLAEKKVKAARRQLTIILFLLFDHIGGINTLLNSLFAGGVAVVPGERSPEAVCRLIERRRVRVLPASPTFLNLILMARFHELFDLSSLRLITYGAEPMPEELLRRVRDAFPRARLLQTFGTSETGIAATSSESSGSTFFRIEGGGVSYRVVGEELHLKSATQFLGYLNHRGDALTEDGWFRTGDLVEQDGAGFIRVRGRASEVINVAGEKVLPVELETLLLQSPLVADCVVYGEPNAVTGHIVCADVVPRDPATTKSEMRKHLFDFLGGRVERFKLPSRLNLVGEVARSDRFKKSRPRA